MGLPILFLSLLPLVISTLRFAEHVVRDVEVRLVDETVPALLVAEKVPGSRFFEDAERPRDSEATAFGRSRRFPFVDQNPVGPQLPSEGNGLDLSLMKRFGQRLVSETTIIPAPRS